MLVVVLVLVLLLVLVFENSAYLAAKVTKDLGLFSAPKPRIEHEHDDETSELVRQVFGENLFTILPRFIHKVWGDLDGGGRIL